MIERELYLKRIRPFIDTDMVKVMTGMRRSGKSIMLELIKGELLKRGVKSCQLVSLNFEDMCYIPLLTASLQADLTASASCFMPNASSSIIAAERMVATGFAISLPAP